MTHISGDSHFSQLATCRIILSQGRGYISALLSFMIQRRGRLQLIRVSLEPALQLCLPAIHIIYWSLSSLACALLDHILDSKSPPSYRGLLHREIKRLLECSSLPCSGIYGTVVSHYASSPNYRALLAVIPCLLPIL
jgi:hypothetical protein